MKGTTQYQWFVIRRAKSQRVMNAISYPLKVDNLNLKIEKLFANRQDICSYTTTFYQSVGRRKLKE
jgi:hypothetical protein